MLHFNFIATNMQKYSSNDIDSCQERQSSGLICESCDLLAVCVKINGNWITVPVETCNTEKGLYCNVNDGSCSNKTGPCHPTGYEGNFACTSEGVFPDPYDCQKYHMCYRAGLTIVSANVYCGSNRAFSPSSGDCSATITNSICQGQQYICNKAGEARPWPGNNNIFYICKASTNLNVPFLYPTLYRCASGEIFNGVDCIEKGQRVDILTTDSIQGTTKSILCTKAGLIIDPIDCHSYYLCSINGLSEHRTCPENTYFNNKTSSCTFGFC